MQILTRSIPLFITAVAGVVMILSAFFPYTSDWGKFAGQFFNILAAFAFSGDGTQLAVAWCLVAPENARMCLPP